MYVCMYVCRYVCMYVCIYVSMYVCIYIYMNNVSHILDSDTEWGWLIVSTDR